MVVPSSAAFFLNAVWVSLETRIMIFLSFLIAVSVYILLYTILAPLPRVVKRIERYVVLPACGLPVACVIPNELVA